MVQYCRNSNFRLYPPEFLLSLSLETPTGIEGKYFELNVVKAPSLQTIGALWDY